MCGAGFSVEAKDFARGLGEKRNFFLCFGCVSPSPPPPPLNLIADFCVSTLGGKQSSVRRSLRGCPSVWGVCVVVFLEYLFKINAPKALMNRLSSLNLADDGRRSCKTFREGLEEDQRGERLMPVRHQIESHFFEKVIVVLTLKMTSFLTKETAVQNVHQ